MSIAVIGAGAAGMMAVATLIENNFEDDIFLFDKNAVLGKKVAITGGGRCNVTTGLRDRKKVLFKYPRGAEFLDYAIRKFSPLAVYKWFERHDVSLKIEEDGRVFPVSDKSSDIIGVFKKMFAESKNVHLHLGNPVYEIKRSGGVFELVSDKGNYFFEKVLVATGGSAYQQTGSSGDAYGRAKEFGHTVTELAPSLSSFEVEESWIKNIPGTVFENAKVVADSKHFVGPLLFTHRGISGPLSFELSAFLAYKNFSKENPFEISFQFDVGKNYQYREQLLLGYVQKYPHKSIKNIISSVFTKRFSELFLYTYFSYLFEDKVCNLRKSDRKKLCHFLSGDLEIKLTGRRPGEEFVTAGGVSCDEVNSKTMESRIIPGLYFAGEVMNVDGVTGGFNLQASRAMGRVAALSF